MDDRYVYKAGSCSIITLEITGKTNEKRGGIADPLHAKFRTSSARVIDIKNFETGLQMEEDVSKHDPEFVYKVGEEVKVVDYYEDINEVCAPGIHYFKTREAAESWFLNSYDIQDGSYRGWHENGQLETEINYKNGKLHGPHKVWYSNGSILKESNFKDGYRDGLYRTRDITGDILREETYKDGEFII
jgi:antitoxin component YwqK of YwqJK toxin-antitoxin module